MKALYLVIIACLWTHALVAALSSREQPADLTQSRLVAQAPSSSLAVGQSALQPQQADPAVQSGPRSPAIGGSQNAADPAQAANDHNGFGSDRSPLPADAELVTN